MAKGRKGKTVVQYSADRKEIAKYPSIKTAAFMTGINETGISKCCLGKREKCGGFLWSFEGELPKENLKKKIEQYDVFGNFIHSFNSPVEAGKSLSPENYVIKANGIRACLSKTRLSFKGYIWIYEGEQEWLSYCMEEYRRQVVSYDLITKEPVYHSSIKEASEIYGVSSSQIQRALRMHGLCRDRAWFRIGEFKQIERFLNEEMDYRIFGAGKPVEIEKDGKIKKYDSVRQAARNLGLPEHSIWIVCNGGKSSRTDVKGAFL